MKRCGTCGLDYPNHCVNALVTSQGNFLLCGTCALEEVNRIHGTQMTRFHGEQAEQARLDSIAWLQSRPAKVR